MSRSRDTEAELIGALKQMEAGRRARLVEMARKTPRFGYRRLRVLRQRKEVANHKRLERVYREVGLALRRRKRKHCVPAGPPLRVCTQANQEGALDFVHDAVECGRAIRVLSVVDAYTRECLALEVDTSLASRRVTRVLEGIVASPLPHAPIPAPKGDGVEFRIPE